MSHFATKKNKVPETVVGDVGTAKRNIIRRGTGGAHTRKEGLAGQLIDDGSIYQDSYALDENDPNYDSEEDDKQNIPRYAPLHRAEIAKSKLTLTTYKKLVQPIIAEFFSSGDLDDVACSIQEIEAPEYSYEFVKRLINASVDKTDHDREQVSQLLSGLYPDILSSNSIGKGFERLFEIIDEIEIDAPNAPQYVSSFIARAVVDEILPPSFLSDSVVRNLGGEIIETAKIMLSQNHAGAKLEKIWGPGDGRPVEEMKIAVDQLLMEYLLSTDLDEAVRCLKQLNALQFFHEVVKRALVMAVDKSIDEQKSISRLIAHLATTNLLTTTQAVKGFRRVIDTLPDISLDAPHAKDVIDGFVLRAKEDNVLPADF